MAVGNQQEIDLGGGTGANDAIKNYAAWVIAQANFDDIYTLLEFIGDFRYFPRDLNLNGVAGNTEWEQVANAINAAPGISVPIGYKPLWRFVRPYNTDRTAVPPIPSNYEQFFYTSVRGAGYYGTGTPPSGVAQITMNGGLVVPLGDFITEAQTLIDLGEIGATAIQTQVNASASELVVNGFTIFQVLRSGVLYQYQFNGEDGSYGLSWTQTNAANFVDIFDNGTVKKDLSGNAAFPTPTAVDITLAQTNLFRTNVLTHDNAVATIQDAATKNFELGVKGRFKFEGTGIHTVNYPTTDGLNQLKVTNGALVEFEKTGDDKWTVKKVGVGSSQEYDLAVSSGELLAVNTTPKTLFPALGADYITDIESLVVEITAGGTVYDFGAGGLTIQGATSGDVLFTITQAQINSATDKLFKCRLDAAQIDIAKNENIVLTAAADPTQGNGTLRVIATAKGKKI